MHKKLNALKIKITCQISFKKFLELKALLYTAES